MKIVADSNIPYLDEFFAPFGEIVKISGRDIKSHHLIDADILLTRSTTKVNASLLNKTAVKFLGTATIGTDHIDLQYLQNHNIAFASAAGCNKQAVVDWVLANLAFASLKLERSFEFKEIAIIGCGNVGGLLAQTLKQLNVDFVVCDPYKDTPYQQVDLKTALEADIITIHTPLNNETHHLLNKDNLGQISPKAWLLNSARGAIIDNQALLQAKAFKYLALDVFENEPLINVELAQKCDIATPHIAGYSAIGRLNGTILIYQALCQYLNVAVDLNLIHRLIPQGQIILPDFYCGDFVRQLYWKSLHYCPLQTLDFNLKQTLHLPDDKRKIAFDNLRANTANRLQSNQLQLM
jgi:erythronate-4-phosphate dehydrogenase